MITFGKMLGVVPGSRTMRHEGRRSAVFRLTQTGYSGVDVTLVMVTKSSIVRSVITGRVNGGGVVNRAMPLITNASC